MEKVWGDDKVQRATKQEKVVIQGTIIYENDFYWIVDEKGNRIGLSWRKDYADKLAEGLEILEDLERQSR